jgi:hypothetical protein
MFSFAVVGRGLLAGHGFEGAQVMGPGLKTVMSSKSVNRLNAGADGSSKWGSGKPRRSRSSNVASSRWSAVSGPRRPPAADPVRAGAAEDDVDADHGVHPLWIIEPGELFVIPRGVEQCPVADEEARFLVVGPDVTSNAAGGKPDWSYSQAD